MSHFTVLVIGAKNEEQVDKKLYPFWELDLSRSELMVDPRAEFNIELSTEEAKEEFEEFLSKAPTPKQVVYAHLNLLKNATEGFSNQAQPINEEEWKKWLESENLDDFSVMYKLDKEKYVDVDDYMQNYHGYHPDSEGEGYGYYHNPNAKWDWYQIGGRWSGYFLAKEGKDGALGEKSWANEGEDIPQNRCDIIKIGDIDFVNMELDKRLSAENNWEKSWEEFPSDLDDEGKDKNYTNRYFRFGIKEETNTPENKQKYIDRQCSMATFAVLKDGEWYENGNMGWWGMVSDEKDQYVWDEEFTKLVKNLDPETYVAVVDCHI